MQTSLVLTVTGTYVHRYHCLYRFVLVEALQVNFRQGLREAGHDKVNIQSNRLGGCDEEALCCGQGSQLWRPSRITDINRLEQLQRRATKFILQDWTSDYKSRLVSLQLLPLMMVYELNDIMFLLSNLKSQSDTFDILKFVDFNSGSTRSNTTKLVHKHSAKNSQRHFYLHRIVKLWNSFPIMDTSHSTATLKKQVRNNLWSVSRVSYSGFYNKPELTVSTY